MNIGPYKCYKDTQEKQDIQVAEKKQKNWDKFQYQLYHNLKE